MNDVVSLNVPFPGKEIFLRLGGHLTRTRISQEDKCRFHSLALRAFEVSHPRGRWQIFPVEKVSETGIILKNGIWIPGRDFAARCSGISALWCGAVTLGHEIVALRDEAEKVSGSAVYDAAGSEIADGAMDMLQKLAAGQLLRQGMILDPRRYSPGYGDMPLDVQKTVFAVLQLEQLEMKLNESFCMEPEKSVTAFAGVKQGDDL